MSSELQPGSLAWVMVTIMTWSEFFSMGGYAFYVWGSYLVALVLVVAEVLMLISCKKRLSARSGANSKD